MAVTNQECLALGLPCPSRLFVCWSIGFPRPTCQDLSASVSCVHACHFASSLDLIMFPIFWNTWTDPMISMLKRNCCWNMMTVLVRREVPSCPSYKQLTSHFGSIVEFRRFSTHMNIRVLSKAYEAIELLAFHGVIALLRTDRDHEQKTCASSFNLHFSSRGKSLMGHWTFSKYPLSLSLNLSCSALCTEAPESTTNIRSSVFLEPLLSTRR